MNSLCIHGHFYQPPREDPISDVIPDETGAQPYSNWNARILAECYRPNAQAGNFEKISFNIGPTLLNWLSQEDPETLGKIIHQENQNYIKYGVGNGMAQGYNHAILPLASTKDKETQVIWGIADFVHHFGHKPAGFWLPETAVDMETLSVLSDHGIEFTILAPWQAHAADIDTTHPYWVALPGGRKPFTVFFYDRQLSTSISFHPPFTENGDVFLHQFLETQNKGSDGLTMIASDGELYGHHQPFRDLFLSYILNGGGHKHDINWTFPSLWLKQKPPAEFIKIRENTSWSCHHGVSRWGEGCDCTPNSQWKRYFRRALNEISLLIDQVYVNFMGKYTTQFWQLRNAYVDVLLGKMDCPALITSIVHNKLSEREIDQITQLLKAQYERQRMFTSCGFYFEDFHRIEPLNNVAYAAKAVWLTKQATGIDLSEQADQLLRPVRSHRSGLRADTVFSQTWLRANDLLEENLS